MPKQQLDVYNWMRLGSISSSLKVFSGVLWTLWVVFNAADISPAFHRLFNLCTSASNTIYFHYRIEELILHILTVFAPPAIIVVIFDRTARIIQLFGQQTVSDRKMDGWNKTVCLMTAVTLVVWLTHPTNNWAFFNADGAAIDLVLLPVALLRETYIYKQGGKFIQKKIDEYVIRETSRTLGHEPA